MTKSYLLVILACGMFGYKLTDTRTPLPQAIGSYGFYRRDFCGTLYSDVIRLNWTILQNIEFQERYVDEVKGYMKFPKFPWTLKNLDGSLVEIEGYTVPFDKTGMKVALSANPYAACYFCGKSGPASVLTVNLKTKSKRYHIDNFKTFRGKLRLNATDIHEFYYILDNAEDVTSD